ncbi:MAG: hypothetical protein IV100_16945 [Myxococcales bacterium]|nr:hypothetical protein [Myxococcales bacterium]
MSESSATGFTGTTLPAASRTSSISAVPVPDMLASAARSWIPITAGRDTNFFNIWFYQPI